MGSIHESAKRMKFQEAHRTMTARIWRNPGAVQESGKAGQRCHPVTAAGITDFELRNSTVLLAGVHCSDMFKFLVLPQRNIFKSYSWCVTMKEVKQWQAADLHKTKVITSQRAPLWFIALLHHILVQLPIGFEDHLPFLKKSGKPPITKKYKDIQKDTSMGGWLIYCPFCMQ